MPCRVLHFPPCVLAWAILCTQSFSDEQGEQNVAPNAAPVEVKIQSGYLDTWFTEEDDETRILLLRVSVQNRQQVPLTISPEAWKLTAEEQERSAIPVPPDFANLKVPVNGKRISFSEIKTDETLTLEPGKQSATWLLFKNLPDSDQIPEMSLACKLADLATVEVDVAETFTNRLKLKSKLIGPANAIALLTINGALDRVSVGALAKKIDEISATKVYRFILNYGPDATAPENNIAGWLRTVARQSGKTPVTRAEFPQLPSALVDFHIVDYRGKTPNAAHAALHSAILRLNVAEAGRTSSSRNVHPELIAAVDSAVSPLCEMLPRERLLNAVRNADEASKAAVLRRGSERFIATNLPLIFSLTENDDLNVATAAIHALRNSSSPSATQKLVDIASNRNRKSGAVEKSAFEIRRAVAVHSLTASKYASAHPEVIRLLSTKDEALISETANAIALHPRSSWRQPLADLISRSDEKTQVFLLPALAAVGHPRLLTILERCLSSSHRPLSAAALNILIMRHEPAAEHLTSQWMLTSLESSSPSPVLLSFLRRTRDHRAIPLLLGHLSEKKIDRHELLTTILTIGDHRVAEQIAAEFENYDFTEQHLILRALAEVHSEDFWKLTSSIIARMKTSDDKSLEGVISLLQKNGSDRAVKLLTSVLAKLAKNDKHSSRHLAMTCAALSSIGTPEARDALLDVVRNSKTATTTARQSLNQLYARSPAQTYVQNGNVRVRQSVNKAEGNEPKEAQRFMTNAMTFLDTAIKIDPGLPFAWQSRGNAALHIIRPTAQQLERARQDFAKYVELEPDDSEGHTGLALVLVRQGKVEEGIAAGLAIHEKSDNDSVYFYNMACIYGRAIEQVEARPDSESPDRNKQIEQYQTKAVKLLKQSIDSGLDEDNLAWMQRDPDLRTIRKSSAFKQLIEEPKLPELPNGLQPR